MENETMFLQHLNHYFTEDELESKMNELGGVDKYKNLKNFMKFVGVDKCQLCENYMSMYIKDTSVLVHGEPRLLCLSCDDYLKSGSELFALKLAHLYLKQMLILTDEEEIVRNDALTIMGTDERLKIEPFTDALLDKGLERVRDDDRDGEPMRLLLEQYDRTVTKIWKCKEIADKTNYLLARDGFTQTAIEKVFNETRLYINYHHLGEFCEVYDLWKSEQDGLYRSMG